MIHQKQQKDANLQPRPPVVVVLGHVDHGKTSLLLAIRKMKVPSQKPGGVITQHVGAYQVEEAGKSITFIDTPGHEAFSAMRSRGAKVADIAILVVAADEGVKPQTKEAILHVKSAGIPMIVAINKIDKTEANPQKVRTELAKTDVVVESMGGQIPEVEVSAKEGKGIKELLDLILLVAEMEDLKADHNAIAEGVVIESSLDAQRGPTATLLVQNGILRLGDIVGTPSCVGKAKILKDFQGKALSQASPSTPVVLVGFEAVPQVGENFKIFPNPETALSSIEKKEEKRKIKPVAVIEPDKKIFNIILKADVQGSLEAIEEILKSIPQENIFLRIVERGVGNVTEGDVKLANSAQGMVIGFRVKVPPQVAGLAERSFVNIRVFDVIYELVQGVRHFMERRLKPEVVRRDIGKMKVLVIFFTERNRQIIGGKVIEGEIRKGLSVEIRRDEESIGQGKILSLQENKKDIEKARTGQEVGILYEGEGRAQEGDVLTFYVKEQQEVTL